MHNTTWTDKSGDKTENNTRHTLPSLSLLVLCILLCKVLEKGNLIIAQLTTPPLVVRSPLAAVEGTDSKEHLGRMGTPSVVIGTVETRIHFEASSVAGAGDAAAVGAALEEDAEAGQMSGKTVVDSSRIEEEPVTWWAKTRLGFEGVLRRAR